jgi:hypothetical protein
MRPFFKENFVLILGISLPLAFIGVFFALQSITKIDAQPPVHKVLLLLNEYKQSNRLYDFNISSDGDLSIIFNHDIMTIEKKKAERARLVLYNPVAEIYDLFDIVPPRDYEMNTDIALTVPLPLQRQTFSAQKIAPDGSEYIDRYRRNNSFFLDMFGHRSRQQTGIQKQGHLYELKEQSEDNFRHAKFIAWVVEND